MLILFPSDFFDTKKIDPDYTAEYEAACKLPNTRIILFNYDSFAAGEGIKIHPKDHYTGNCVYRGWMLTPVQYSALYEHLKAKNVTLINSPVEYEACHLFPSVRDIIGEDTPKSLYYEQGRVIDWDKVNGTFGKFMIKDYVKSVKGTTFPLFFETPVLSDEMNNRIAEFRALRGNLFTGGIVLKEFVNFKKYGKHTNEYRAFFLNGLLLSLSRNSNQPESCPRVPQDFCMKFRRLKSNYYTVDFGELEDGRWIVIETGDGQVSGLSPGQVVFKYYEDMQLILNANG